MQLMLIGPFGAALALGLRGLIWPAEGEGAERGIARIGKGGIGLGLAGWLWSALAEAPGAHRAALVWPVPGWRLEICLEAAPAPMLAAGFSLLACLGVASFSDRYFHRETGFLRFYLLLCLFSGAMVLISLGGSLLALLAGWEIAGACSALMIAFFHRRPAAAAAGLRAALTNRPGDLALLLAAAVGLRTAGSLEWEALNGMAAAHPFAGTALGGLLLTAAGVKAGLPPFTPWLARAVGGPTPTSALFYGALIPLAGPLLIGRITPMIVALPWLGAACVAWGLVAAGMAWAQARVLTDAKGQAVHLGVSAVGLGVAGLGLAPALALALAPLAPGWLPGAVIAMLVAHALLRGWQILRAPSELEALPARPAGSPAALARWPWLERAARDRFGLERMHRQAVAEPILRLSERLDRLDAQVLERATGLEPSDPADPAVGPALIRARGAAGRLLHHASESARSFEERYVAVGLGRGVVALLLMAGRTLQTVEEVLEEPAVAIVLALLILSGLYG